MKYRFSIQDTGSNYRKKSPCMRTSRAVVPSRILPRSCASGRKSHRWLRGVHDLASCDAAMVYSGREKSCRVLALELYPRPANWSATRTAKGISILPAVRFHVVAPREEGSLVVLILNSRYRSVALSSVTRNVRLVLKPLSLDVLLFRRCGELTQRQSSEPNPESISYRPAFLANGDAMQRCQALF